MNSTTGTKRHTVYAAAIFLLMLAYAVFAGPVAANAADDTISLGSGAAPPLILTEYGSARGQHFILIAANSSEDHSDFDDDFDDIDFDDEAFSMIADPIEPFNRAMFVFNDKLYYWVLKPTAGFYGRTVPKKGRIAVRRFFTNVATPIRLVNAVVQLKFKYAGTELARFCINTTVGFLGFKDPARDRWNIYLHKEDFGQSIGHYGAGPGFFITWPIFGPSSLRDTFGLIGDFFLDPATYIFAEDRLLGAGVWSYDKVNDTSLDLTLYEDLTKSALDPYLFIRDAYHQHREELIRE
ncbi:Outer-membrane-phospholipid-binding lipoprotein MlaA [hydrothermal vent metagenome]|uniref:Outer-membrane-phospholipid-binding lipoprotein MlaA n=1 Tax=hydrothermal vent metagenome TaxID=652676 RepID=A0A3B0R2B2_9ZZZZ